MAFPELSSSNVIDLWYHYEQVAMHFNELIMQFRLQLMGGLGAIGAVSGYLVGGKVEDPHERKRPRAMISTFLLVLVLAAASLDLFYYDRLLQGAVNALSEFEAKHPPIDMSTLIEKTVTHRGLYPIWFAYGVILLSLLAFSAWSWCEYVKKPSVLHPNHPGESELVTDDLSET